VSERGKVIVTMPAYNAARTLEKTYGDLPQDVVDEIILVDDVSQDETVEIARRLGLKVIIHIQNTGYGGNQKTCYLEALKDGADIVVMLHPDYQYDSRLVPELIRPIQEGKADLVLGHTGFRAYSRRFLETIPFLLNSDRFVFDSQVLAQAVAFGFEITEIPVPTRYFEEASSVAFRDGVIYGLQTVGVVLKYLLNKLGIMGSDQFQKELSEIVSRYHSPSIFRREKDA